MARQTDTVLLIVYLLGGASVTFSKMNVLFLVSDDMRPQLGAYEGPDYPAPVHPKMHTPSLDSLASQSLLLKRAYVQQAVCSPSRTSLLTGRRPDTTHVWDLVTYWRNSGGNFTTIPQYFKDHGYISVGMGKVFHPGEAASGHDDPISWSEKYFHANNSAWKNEGRDAWMQADEEKVKQYPLEDMQIATKAIETLERLAPKAKTGEQPFFIAVGFHRPHLPFLCPKSFYDLYPEDSIRLPANPYIPEGMPEYAWGNFGDLRKFGKIRELHSHGGINTTFPDEIVKALRRAYYACLSYTDSLVGQVIGRMEELGLGNNTIVSFWGDHGWQLGEHAEWCKHTNFELATHSPMMVRVPGLTDEGVVTEALTEFVDLFPTLAEAAGLPTIPLCPEHSSHIPVCTEGVSLVPLIKNPNHTWKSASFSQYPRIGLGGRDIMGYTMRTEKYRFTQWMNYDRHNYTRSQKTGPTELYDHSIDPQENVNRAGNPQYRTIKQELQRQLWEGWRAALPPDMNVVELVSN